MSSFRRGSRGFTLVETLAALLVFSIVTLGLVPLVLSSIRGSNVSRSLNIAKNATLEAMERVRGLPWRVEYANQPVNRRVDLLDMFYPDGVGGRLGGQSYSAGVFTTVCTRASTGNPACLADKLPRLSNFTLTARACFSNVTNGNPACLNNAGNRAVWGTPSTYAWNLDRTGDGVADAGATDAPPQGSQLVEFSLTSTWNVGPVERQYEMRTLLSDRNFGAREFSGVAEVAHAAEVTTGFSEGGRESQMTASVGGGESFVESTPLQILARQTIQAGQLRLQDVTDPAAPADLVSPPLAGAGGTVEEPGTSAPSGPVGELTLQHPVGHPLAGSALAFLNDSTAPTLLASTGQATTDHEAEGSYSVTAAVGEQLVFAATNRVDNAALRLDTTPGTYIFSISQGAAATGGTSAEVGRVGTTDRRVQTGATIDLDNIRVFPTDFIGADPDSAGETSVILIDDFTATVNCDARASASSVAEAQWSASLRVWEDTTAGDGPDGSYGAPITLGPGTVDPLADLQTNANNPLVFEANRTNDPDGHPDDVYLFPVTHVHGDDDDGDDDETVTHQHPGYLSDAAIAQQVESTVGTDDRIVAASVRNAIRLTSVPLHSSSVGSRVAILIGSLSCSAEDQR